MNFSQRIKAVVKEKKAHSSSPCNVCVLRVKKTAGGGDGDREELKTNRWIMLHSFCLCASLGSAASWPPEQISAVSAPALIKHDLRSLSVAPLATRRYKLLNTFPSCTVPRVRQEICTGDLASNGAVPQRFWTHARLRYVGGITGEVWVELTAA